MARHIYDLVWEQYRADKGRKSIRSGRGVRLRWPSICYCAFTSKAFYIIPVQPQLANTARTEKQYLYTCGYDIILSVPYNIPSNSRSKP